MKNTRIYEGVSLQFRADLFNLFNIVNPGKPQPNSERQQQLQPSVSRPALRLVSRQALLSTCSSLERSASNDCSNQSPKRPGRFLPGPLGIRFVASATSRRFRFPYPNSLLAGNCSEASNGSIRSCSVARGAGHSAQSDDAVEKKTRPASGKFLRRLTRHAPASAASRSCHPPFWLCSLFHVSSAQQNPLVPHSMYEPPDGGGTPPRSTASSLRMCRQVTCSRPARRPNGNRQRITTRPFALCAVSPPCRPKSK